MSALQIAWGVALIVTVGALPVGAFRMLAYRTEPDWHTRTMGVAARFALGLGLLALVCLVVLSFLVFG